MSQIDSELTLLKQRLSVLEEQKRLHVEKEAEKKANPMKVIEGILEEKKTRVDTITKGVYDNFDNVIRQHTMIYTEDTRLRKPELYFFNEKDKIAMLEPIFNALVNIQKRLDVLEKKGISIDC